jgi:glycine/D-amino acid oxidase-like deaminating enzyme/nitrite reductase/ring-hydroxylating ferredoxin subunit
LISVALLLQCLISSFELTNRTAMDSTEPLWMNVPRRDFYARYRGEGRHWDVAIIGAGITGVTCAWALAREGVSVAVFEAHEVGSGATSFTSAHLTEVLDLRYHRIISAFGEEAARELAQGSRDAIDFIERTSLEQKIDCQFRRVPGHLFAQNQAQAAELAREEAACKRAGVEVHPASGPGVLPLPFDVVGSLEFPRQAQFQPRAWVLGLASQLPSNHCQLFEASRVTHIEEGLPCRLTFANGGFATADRVVMATHSPLNWLFFQTRLARYQTYVVSGPSPLEFDGLFWDLDEPYHYMRSVKVDGQSHLIVGGEDHKTGQEPDTRAAFDRLASYARRLGVTVDRAWSSQVVATVDGLPMIGRNAASANVFVATGYDGNGLTFGTAAGHLLAEACLGKTFVRDAVKPAEAKSVNEVGRGEGKWVRVKGKRVAVYRDGDDHLHAVSSVCTHMGCHVHFNTAQKTWDCPCHGARFDVDGQVLEGPTTRALAPVDLDEKPSRGEAPRPSAPH